MLSLQGQGSFQLTGLLRFGALELAALQAEDYDLALIGFDADELSELMAEESAALTDEDQVPIAQSLPVAVAGDLWLLGPHRLICGDSTSAEIVESFLNGAKPGLMVTDLPDGR